MASQTAKKQGPTDTLAGYLWPSKSVPDPASHIVDLRDLRLDTAHALVAQASGSEAALRRDQPSRYLQGLIDGLCELSLKDHLTGLANRRHFRAVLEREIDRVTRSGEAALLLMLDIDHFKQINDTYGHLAGDVVLQSVSRTLSACVRPMDTGALRWRRICSGAARLPGRLWQGGCRADSPCGGQHAGAHFAFG